MAVRIDALGDSKKHLEPLVGRVLEPDVDPELQELVSEAAAKLSTPIALISLMLRRTQFFRAFHGVPPDLCATRATDRTVSFCQFVVRDEEPLIVNHAAEDDRVPQDLVERYGIQAYAGTPVRIGDQVVGSLCVIDVSPREFSKEEIDILPELAERASRRLSELAQVSTPEREIMQRASAPAFADMRNALAAITCMPNELLAARQDLNSIAQLAAPSLSAEERHRAAGALEDATLALDDIRDVADALRTSNRRLVEGVRGLETLLDSRGKSSLSDAIAAADRLAAHHTMLVGGLEWKDLEEAVQVRTTGSVITAVVATCLSELSIANPRKGPLRLESAVDDATVRLTVSLDGAGATSVEKLTTRVQEITRGEPGLVVTEADEGVKITLAR